VKNFLLTTVTLLGMIHCINAEEKKKKPFPEIKNVLFVISDDLRASVLPIYGDEMCKTPNIDRLAASGLVFERAYCQGTACQPSRPSIMHSLYPNSHTKVKSIGEHLQKFDIHTSRVSKVFHMGIPKEVMTGINGSDVAACWTERYNVKALETNSPGLFRQLNKASVTREVKGRDATGKFRMWTSVESDVDNGSDQADYMAVSKAIEILNERKAKKNPFFLAVGLVRPHYPMVAPKRFFDMHPLEKIKIPPQIPGDRDDIPKAGHGHDGKGLENLKDERRRMWQGYYATVSFMDEQLGRLIDELDRLGLRESTAIIFTSDHGYHLGEHDFWQKPNMHEHVARVPLIISAPSIKVARSSSPVELVDFYPTCTDLFNIATPKGIHGKSLIPILKDPKHMIRDTALILERSGQGGSVRSKKWQYFKYTAKGGGEELYDMEKDPEQYTNLLSNPEYSAVLNEYRQKLKKRLDNVQWIWNEK
jgi:iduronate 2-sulfatase